MPKKKKKKKEFENVSHQVLVEDNVIIIQQRSALLDGGGRYSDQMTNSRKQNHLFFPFKKNKGVRKEPTGLGSMLNEVGSSMISWVVCSILDMKHVVLRAFQRGCSRKQNQIKEESIGRTTPGH